MYHVFNAMNNNNAVCGYEVFKNTAKKKKDVNISSHNTSCLKCKKINNEADLGIFKVLFYMDAKRNYANVSIIASFFHVKIELKKGLTNQNYSHKQAYANYKKGCDYYQSLTWDNQAKGLWIVGYQNQSVLIASDRVFSAVCSAYPGTNEHIKEQDILKLYEYLKVIYSMLSEEV